MLRRSSRTLRTALNALRRNVMRSILTTLGIIIGVASVIAMMEIGKGTSADIQRTIVAMGANTLVVLPGQATSSGVSWGAGSVYTLTPQDCDAILRECPAILNAAPVVNAPRSQVVYGNRNWVPPSLFGTTPAYLEVRAWNNMAEGEPFTDRDVRNASKVCIIGQTIARQLFEGESPVGKELRVQNVSFKVVGVLGRKGANMMGMDQDDIVIAPWTTIKYRVTGASSVAGANSAAASSSISASVNTLNQLYPTQATNLYPAVSPTQAADTPLPVRFANVNQIVAAARSATEMDVAIRQITQLLHERHRIRAEQSDDFNIRDPTEFTNAFTKTTSLMTTLLACVACISLVVGGVGIMNIMLVSVTERTREIGLRMAVGARSGNILWQFLVEAVVLCMMGGALGIVLGRGGSYLVHVLLKFPTEISPLAIFLSVIVSFLVGVIFGFYPAWKASRLDPIEALRYE
jgi:ABC-type antimicrobial peptide transport system permease subunit